MRIGRCLAAALLVATSGCSDQEGPLVAGAPDMAPLLSAGSGAIDGSYIVVLKDGADPRSVAAVAGVHPRHVYTAALAGFAAPLNAGQLNALRRNPNVDYVTEDSRVTAAYVQHNAPWGLDRIDQRATTGDGIFNYTPRGIGVRAYVLDTGIRTSHVQFDTARASVGADFVGDGKNGQDCHGHGTHVAGTIGGTTYGVAKLVSLVSVRVLDCNAIGDVSDVVEGIDWVAANHVKPAVANLSLGGGVNQALDDAVNGLHAAGVTVVVAAGNDNQNACNVSPARVANAITVGATDATDARAFFSVGASNWGSCVDLFAPGKNIISAWIGSNTATNTISGTSMASPHVAGVAALYLHLNRSDTPAEVTTALFAGATTGTVTNAGTGSPNRLLYSLRVNATVTGPTTVPSTGIYTWYATATDGTGSYTYDWRYRVKGTTAWTLVRTGPSFTDTVAVTDPDFELHLTVKSSNIPGYDTHAVDVGSLDVTISGTSFMYAGDTGYWTAYPTGGTGAYTYQWQYGWDGSSWTNGGTSKTYSRTSNYPFYVRVIVTSGGASVTSAAHHVWVEPSPCVNQLCP